MSIYFVDKKGVEWRRKKGTPPNTTHHPLQYHSTYYHTKTISNKKLHYVGLLPYVDDYTYYIKVCMAFAKKIPVLSADNAIFIVVPPHLLFGHTKLTVKNNQPNNITTLLAFIFLLFNFIYPNILITTLPINAIKLSVITIEANPIAT